SRWHLEVLLVKREDLLPAVNGLFLAIVGSIGGEKTVAGAVVAIELVLLAALLQLSLNLVDLLDIRIGVVIAEDPEQRAAHLWREFDRRPRVVGRKPIRPDDNAATPAIHRRIQAVDRACRQ